jgi:exonuclease III
MNINGLNALIKRQIGLKNKAQPYVAYKRLMSLKKNKHLLRVKGWKKVFQVNGPHKLAGIAILISDKVDFRLKSIRRDNECHVILIKGTIHQEEISILNIYAPNTVAPFYIKKKTTLMALRSLKCPNTVIVGDLNTPLSPINRSSRQKINKETSKLLNTLDQIDMVDIYRVFHPTTRQYMFFSATHGTFSKTDHNL